MTRKLSRALASSAAITAIASVVPVTADAATRHRSHRAGTTRSGLTRAANSSGPSAGTSAETALTGTTLSSASTAALAAVPGGTVDSATTEADGTGAYEVIVTKSDSSRVKVVEDSGFAVLSMTATNCR